ncbi:Glycosyl hydrolases family 43 [Tsuneonella dongtanensis]|uniref:Glycosyl hydrolases family 43 n=2 Tax=Tsuneonella dongtanensis TaxID=692370 RepID=A0A1B2AB93_9SPHN|nr:Glycosyl hydrolases family 43 [Tsuneonella dongtanensis]
MQRRAMMKGMGAAVAAGAMPDLALAKGNSFTWQNPIFDGITGGIRDAQVLRDGGRWHLVGTAPEFWTGPNLGVRIFSSDTLTSWGEERLLIDRSKLDPSVWYYDRFWAPEIHRIEGKYWLVVNCRNESEAHKHSHGTLLARADALDGPYEILTPKQPLVTGNDMTIFTDDDGQTFGYWNQEKVIKGGRLWLDGGKFLGEPWDCFYVGGPQAWDKIGIEGPYVIKRDGRYYMFYSSWSRGYEIGYATADRPEGPWTKFSGNPIYGAQNERECEKAGLACNVDTRTPYRAVGHNEVFTGPDGRLWISCHGILRDGPHAGIPSLVIEPIDFVNGEIRIKGPTSTPQTVTW